MNLINGEKRLAKIEHHSAYAFLIYYLIWICWKGAFIIGGEYRYIVLFIIICGMAPDFDSVYWFIKKKGKIKNDTTEFQHHLYFWTHWPISWTPLIIFFIISLIFNFYPEFFLAPVVGVYGGHLLFDSISCGDGIMWGKIPWKKGSYARYINLIPNGTDGYHGIYWEVRYRKTLINKIGTMAVIISIIILTIFFIYTMIDTFYSTGSPGISGYYLMPIIFFVLTLIISLKKVPEKFLEEPPEGRYADYRLNIVYIKGLNDRNRKKHIEKYKSLLEEKGVLEQIKLK